MQKAYGYLTNPTTRVIYDRFGVSGIKVYEMYSDEFRELSEELRTRGLNEERKTKLEEAIVRKSENLIKVNIRNQLQQTYKKEYGFVLEINMKSFCNNYHRFYFAGQPLRAL
jgi:predicted translin family RNA/ssDNA-binding protein